MKTVDKVLRFIGIVVGITLAVALVAVCMRLAAEAILYAVTGRGIL